MATAISKKRKVRIVVHLSKVCDLRNNVIQQNISVKRVITYTTEKHVSKISKRSK